MQQKYFDPKTGMERKSYDGGPSVASTALTAAPPQAGPAANATALGKPQQAPPIRPPAPPQKGGGKPAPRQQPPQPTPVPKTTAPPIQPPPMPPTPAPPVIEDGPGSGWGPTPPGEPPVPTIADGPGSGWGPYPGGEPPVNPAGNSRAAYFDGVPTPTPTPAAGDHEGLANHLMQAIKDFFTKPSGQTADEAATAASEKAKRAAAGHLPASKTDNSPQKKADDIENSNDGVKAFDGMKKINIKPSHKGELHSELGVPQGQKIPSDKLAQAKNSSNPAERKRATFAQNAKKWSHDGEQCMANPKYAGIGPDDGPMRPMAAAPPAGAIGSLQASFPREAPNQIGAAIATARPKPALAGPAQQLGGLVSQLGGAPKAPPGNTGVVGPGLAPPQWGTAGPGPVETLAPPMREAPNQFDPNRGMQAPPPVRESPQQTNGGYGPQRINEKPRAKKPSKGRGRKDDRQTEK